MKTTVVIIGILAGIAIPNLLASRRAANEASTLSALRTIHSCEVTYFSTVGNGDYTDLQILALHTLTDDVGGTGTRSGYSSVVNSDCQRRPSLTLPCDSSAGYSERPCASRHKAFWHD